MEDYASEILGGILQYDQSLLDRYVNQLLGVSGSKFLVSTRRSFVLDEDSRVIPDLIFENPDHIIFQENKVFSSEGREQLNSYARLLQERHRKTGKVVHLRYCTAAYTERSIDLLDFQRLRWIDVARFLSDVPHSDLITDFVAFMEETAMANLNGFEMEDLASMVRIHRLIPTIEACLSGSVESELQKIFGEIKWGHRQWYRQLTEFKRYPIWSEGVIGAGYSEVLLAVQFERVSDESAIPTLVGQLWANGNEYVSRQLAARARSNGHFTHISGEDDWVYLCHETDLAQFVGMSDQINQIQNWFIQAVHDIDAFRKNNQDLPWSE